MVINDVDISDQAELNEVALPREIKPKLIILNYQEHSYAKIRFDPHTLSNLAEYTPVRKYFGKLSVEIGGYCVAGVHT